MILHGYCCVVQRMWILSPEASPYAKPPTDPLTGEVIGPPRVKDGTLIFWRTEDGKPDGKSPQRFSFPVPPGARPPM
jgi:hypothetical protein